MTGETENAVNVARQYVPASFIRLYRASPNFGVRLHTEHRRRPTANPAN